MFNFVAFSGDRIRGGGVCANLPVFFSQTSGLVAVVPRESASMLPEMMEDSLCSSLAGPGSEVQLTYRANNITTAIYRHLFCTTLREDSESLRSGSV